LPDSGNITALDISGMMLIGVSIAFYVGDLIIDPVGREKTLLIPQVRLAHKYPISPWGR
jgi:hypothetical protein